MKKIFALLLLCNLAFQSFATGFIKPPLKAATIFISIGKTGRQISLLDLSRIDVKGFETLTGRHLHFFDKIGFKLSQRGLRKRISADGTINSKKLTRYINGDPSRGFNIGGFALGFFVGIIGVVIAYLIDDDYKRNRVKWAWIGFGIGFLLSLVLLAVVISQLTAF